MKFLGPTRHPRLNEAGAFVFLLAGLFIFLSLASYYAFDPSWNTASSVAQASQPDGPRRLLPFRFFIADLGLGGLHGARAACSCWA